MMLRREVRRDPASPDRSSPASDYSSLHKDGKDDRDLFLLHLNQLLINAMGRPPVPVKIFETKCS
jgi:hypothetical protein